MNLDFSKNSEDYEFPEANEEDDSENQNNNSNLLINFSFKNSNNNIQELSQSNITSPNNNIHESMSQRDLFSSQESRSPTKLANKQSETLNNVDNKVSKKNLKKNFKMIITPPAKVNNVNNNTNTVGNLSSLKDNLKPKEKDLFVAPIQDTNLGSKASLLCQNKKPEANNLTSITHQNITSAEKSQSTMLVSNVATDNSNNLIKSPSIEYNNTNKSTGLISKELNTENPLPSALEPENNLLVSKLKTNKDFENFLKPNPNNSAINNFNNFANLSNSNNTIASQFLLQNNFLNNNLNSNINNLLTANAINSLNSINGINNLTYLSGSTPTNVNRGNTVSNNGTANNFLNFSNLANTKANNINSCNNFPSFFSVNNSCGNPGTPSKFQNKLIAFNNLNTLNLGLGNNKSNYNINNNITNNFNGLNNNQLGVVMPKKETIDFTNLQSIKHMDKQLLYGPETPGTATDHNLNTISSLHSNLNIRELNTLESRRKSTQSLSPFYSDSFGNSANFYLAENLPLQNTSGLEIFDNPNLKNLYQTISASDSSLNKCSSELQKFSSYFNNINMNNNNIGSPIISSSHNSNINANNFMNLASFPSSLSNNSFGRHISNLALSSNNDNLNMANKNPSFTTNNSNYIKDEYDKNEKFEYIKKNSNSSINSMFNNNNNNCANNTPNANATNILEPSPSSDDNLTFRNNIGCYSNNNSFSTPSNSNHNNSMNSNAANSKRANFSSYNRIYNFNQYKNFNIKIGNLNNNISNNLNDININNNTSNINNFNITSNNNAVSNINDLSNLRNFNDFILNMKNNLANIPAGEFNSININNSITNDNNNNDPNHIISENQINANYNSSISTGNDLNNYINNINNMRKSGNNLSMERKESIEAEKTHSKNQATLNAAAPEVENEKKIIPFLFKNNFINNLERKYDDKFDNLESCIDQYIQKYNQIKDHYKSPDNNNLYGFTDNFEVFNHFDDFENLKTFIEKISLYKAKGPQLYQGLCEKYKYLYLDSDCEIKFVILKKILADFEKSNYNHIMNAQSNKNISSRDGSCRSAGSANFSLGQIHSKVEDNEAEKQQEMLKFGFKDIADKYYSNIQRTHSPNNSNEVLNGNTALINNTNNLNFSHVIVNNERTPRGKLFIIFFLKIFLISEKC